MNRQATHQVFVSITIKIAKSKNLINFSCHRLSSHFNKHNFAFITNSTNNFYWLLNPCIPNPSILKKESQSPTGGAIDHNSFPTILEPSKQKFNWQQKPLIKFLFQQSYIHQSKNLTNDKSHSLNSYPNNHIFSQSSNLISKIRHSLNHSLNKNTPNLIKSQSITSYQLTP